MCVNKSNICVIFVGLIGLSFAEVKNDLAPLVAFHCGRPAMHLMPQGWIADNGTDCLTSPVDILAYCKKSFPNLDIRNYVEADREVTVNSWCNFTGENCDQSFQVQPFQCMVGPFVLIDPVVPDQCLVNRTIRSTECTTSIEWKSVAVKSCARHGLEMSWFSILQPCDIGRFSGVQYVCCPSGEVPVEVVNSFPALVSESSSTAQPSQLPKDAVLNDVYVDLGNKPENEHTRYLRAKAELRKKHDDEVSKIMDAWDEAQREVEKMKAKDPDMADKLEKKITARFQKTINSIDEKEETEKRQMESVHDQKVQMELNNKKREAMEAYMAVLSNRKHATLRDILKVLKHYVRVEQKDRMHVINHYQHLKETDPTAAESIRALAAEHLQTIRLRINRAREMLNRVPEFKEEIQSKIKSMLEEYQEFDGPESSIVQMVGKDAGGNQSSPKEEEEEEEEEDENKKKRLEVDGKEGNSLGVETDLGVSESKKDLGKVVLAGHKDKVQDVERENIEVDQVLYTENVERDNGGVVQVKPVAPSHLGTNELLLEERNSLIQKHSSGSSLVTLMFVVTGSIFLVAVSILGVLVLRRRLDAARRRRKTADDSLLLASPEQTHIANMQVNGYENPTYKYFEVKAVI